MDGTAYRDLTDEELDRQLEENATQQAIDERLARDMADLASDPLEFVLYAYDWGRGDLTGFDGPDSWQTGWLKEWGQAIRLRQFDGVHPVLPYAATTTSGHGVGKSAMTGWVTDCIMSTRPHSKGIVSANSIPQLETKTWAEIAKWTKRCITSHWFRITTGRGAMKIVSREFPDDWRVDGMAWDKDRPAAFAGLHAATSSPWFIFDEASEVARIILETAQGGLTDGEPFFFMFSNPTAGAGFFYDSHHSMAHRYKTFKIDSRTSRMTNKVLIQQWIDDRGIDSDFVKVRVLGEFPLTGNRQFIEGELLDLAMSPDREPSYTPTDALVLGVDVARFGGDEATIYIRQGRDGRSRPPKIFNGIDTHQLSLEVKKLAEELLPDAINVDAGGMGVAIIDNLRNWKIPNVYEINFGGTSPDPEYKGMATYMMGMGREWLKKANTCMPIDPTLRAQAANRKYWMVEGVKITAYQVESKEEIRKRKEKGDEDANSPDRSDGFFLTFATPTGARDVAKTRAMLAGETFRNVITEYERN